MDRSLPFMKHSVIGAAAALVLAASAPAAAQPDRRGLELGVQVPSAVSSEFDTTGVGLGGRLAWRAGWLGVEAELNAYPGDFPGGVAFSSGRMEGLFGATAGPRLGRARPFAKLRPGFMTFQPAPEPFGCIAIFPPPISCTLAAGRTVFALDAGGGIEIDATPRAFVRVDASDLLLKYPGPTLDLDLERRDSFFGHDFRFAAGVGIRF
jgi:Outer membrane protein beta-barrel domain